MFVFLPNKRHATNSLSYYAQNQCNPLSLPEQLTWQFQMKIQPISKYRKNI